MQCRFCFPSFLCRTQAAHTPGNKVVYCSHMSAVAYITQETKDVILKGALDSLGLSSTGCWHWIVPKELHVHKFEPHCGCGKVEEFSWLEQKKGSERVDGIFFSNVQIVWIKLATQCMNTDCLLFIQRLIMAQRANGCQRDRVTRTEWEVPVLQYFLSLRMLLEPQTHFPLLRALYSVSTPTHWKLFNSKCPSNVMLIAMWQ